MTETLKPLPLRYYHIRRLTEVLAAYPRPHHYYIGEVLLASFQELQKRGYVDMTWGDLGARRYEPCQITLTPLGVARMVEFKILKSATVRRPRSPAMNNPVATQPFPYPCECPAAIVAQVTARFRADLKTSWARGRGHDLARI